MKIAVRGGHVPKFTGASKFIDELTEDRKVKNSLINALAPVTFGTCPPLTAIFINIICFIKMNRYK